MASIVACRTFGGKCKRLLEIHPGANDRVSDGVAIEHVKNGSRELSRRQATSAHVPPQ